MASAGALEARAEELGVAPPATATATSASAPQPIPASPSSTASVQHAPDTPTPTTPAPAAVAVATAAPAPSTPPPATPKPTDLDKGLAELRAIKSDLGNTGLQLLPRFGARPDLEHGIHTPLDYFEPGMLHHFWGTLAAAVSLSLGAPFWFNALKQLANLRSIVANKEQKEREGSAGEAPSQ